jgi:hypothetical protein
MILLWISASRLLSSRAISKRRTISLSRSNECVEIREAERAEETGARTPRDGGSSRGACCDAHNPSIETTPECRLPLQADGWRSQRDGCSAPDNAARVPVRRMAASHKPPNPRGIAYGGTQRMPSPASVAGKVQRTQACPGGKRVSACPRIFREILGSKPRPAGRSDGVRESTWRDPAIVLRLARRNECGDAVAEFAPRYVRRSRIRSPRRGVWDQQRPRPAFRRWRRTGV